MKYHLITKSLITVFTLLIIFSFSQQKKEKKLEVTTANLMGAFGGNIEYDKADLIIYEDSIFYPDPIAWVTYQLKNDTIVTIDEEAYIEKFLVLKLTNDSLIMNNLSFNKVLHLNRRE